MKVFSIAAIFANLLLVLLVVNGSIYKKQHIIETGRSVYVKLAPRDPRSLMQGDYMVLRLELLIDQDDRDAMKDEPTRGRIVLALDERNIGTFDRAENATPLRDNELFLKYRRSKRGYLFGLESFFFEEGASATLQPAKFCEIKVDGKGNAVLVDLLGEDLRELVPKTDD